MRISRWMCLSVLAVPIVLPVASQTNLTPNAALGAPDRGDAPGTVVSASEPGFFEPAAEQLADQLMQQGRYQEALESYQRVIVPSARLWRSMGKAYQLLLDFNDARRYYRESIKLDPTDARVVNNLATVYDQLQDHRRAESLYREAIRLDPHSAIYFKNLGTNLLAQHEFKKGSAAYRQALAIDPHALDDHNVQAMALPHKDNAATNYARARSCAQSGLIDCTVVYLRKALDEGAATPTSIASDDLFAQVRNTPEVRELLQQR